MNYYIKLHALIIVLLVYCTCVSCGINNVEKLSPAATQTTKQFYQYVKQRQFDSTISLFSEKCFSNTPADSIIAIIKRMNQRDGDIVSATLEENTYSKNVKGGQNQNEFIQVYRVVYSSGFVTKEEFTFSVSEQNAGLGKVDAYVIDFYQ